MKTIFSQDILKEPVNQIAELTSLDGMPDAKQMHQTRVAIKRLRACLRLVSDQLETAPLHDKARELSAHLSGSRDQHVAAKLLDKLSSTSREAETGEYFQSVKATILGDENTEQPELEVIRGLANEIRGDFEKLPHYDIPLKKLKKAIRKAARLACKNGEKAKSGNDCHRLHVWRKQVKRLFYQNEALMSLGQDFHLRMGKLERLGIKLGKIHDICVLEAGMHEHHTKAGLPVDHAGHSSALEILAKRRKRLAKQSKALHKAICKRVR